MSLASPRAVQLQHGTKSFNESSVHREEHRASSQVNLVMEAYKADEEAARLKNQR